MSPWLIAAKIPILFLDVAARRFASIDGQLWSVMCGSYSVALGLIRPHGEIQKELAMLLDKYK
ncbi:MAG: hypothetical protein R3274_02130 [Desulfobacterales bacterium]|nr:hypothetical protein [Desulfobacterales bacterium]